MSSQTDTFEAVKVNVYNLLAELAVRLRGPQVHLVLTVGSECYSEPADSVCTLSWCLVLMMPADFRNVVVSMLPRESSICLQ